MAQRTDHNQIEIMKALRILSATVQSLHIVGRGCPDLVIGYRGVNLLAEVKSEKGRLTDLERKWFETWRGQVEIIRSVEEAAAILNKVSNSDLAK